MRPAAMRPLGVGEILDVAINICLRHAGTLLRLTLGIIIPVQVLSTLISLSVSADDEDDAGLPGSGTLDPSSGDGTIDNDVWIELAGFGLIGLLALFAGVFATAACFRAISEAYLGRSPDWRESYRFAVPRILSLLWVIILTALGVALGFVLLIVPGLLLYVWWSVAAPVLLAEGVRGRRALGRSRQLVRGRWWPVFGVIVVGVILAGVITAGLAAVSNLLVSGESDSAGRIVADGVAGLVSSAITTPLTAAFTVVLYFDLRVRKEGFDLELLADHLAGRAAVPGDAGREGPGGPVEDDRPLW
jgi:hypothetical protein